MFPGVDCSVDFPSTYEVKEFDLSHNPTITVDNNSACCPTDEDLDVKLPATTKTDDVLLEDLVPTSIPSSHTATNRIRDGEQLNVSQDLNNFHVFNDPNKMNSNENNEEEHSKIKVNVTNHQKDTGIESKVVSRTTTQIVNLDHIKEFQESMDSYKIGNGVCSFDTIALAIAFFECTCNVHLIVTKSSSHNYQQNSCKQHLGCTFHVSFGHHYSTGLLHMKKCSVLHNWFSTVTTAKGGRTLKKRRKRQFQQSFLNALVMFILLSQRVHHTIISNILANNT